MRWSDTFGVAVVTAVISLATGKIATRCYTCRSRGDLGDCKDPFANNQTLVGELPGKPVHTTSCPSGWCRKQVEGVRGPGDGNYKVKFFFLRLWTFVSFSETTNYCHDIICDTSYLQRLFFKM